MGNEATKKKDNLREDLLQSEINGHSIKGLKKKMDMTGQDVFDIIKLVVKLKKFKLIINNLEFKHKINGE